MELEDEWLETDGLGGFAMGTVSGIRSRRYHGLLVHARRPPAERAVLVAGLEVWLETSGGSVALSSQRYAPGVVHPDGATRQVAFATEPWPRWTWRLDDGVEIDHELFMTHRAPAVVLRWRRRGAGARGRLCVRPLLAGRDFHHLRRGGSWPAGVAVDGGRVVLAMPDGMPAVHAATDGRYEHAPSEYRNFHYVAEAARGLDADEDLMSPGVFSWPLDDGDGAALILSAGPVPLPSARAGDAASALRAAERDRREAFATPLERAGDAYIAGRGDGLTVIAGYPWFGDWGRDTFIALRGLCLATGRLDDAGRILGAWAEVVSEGMLPNRFPDHGDAPEYNSVDASLWYVIAASEYLRAAAPRATPIKEAIAAILRGYAAGTRYGIRVDPADGLVACGVPGVQLTWMDAKVGEWVVTPRTGKPVEIQALWLNALSLGGDAAPELGPLLARGLDGFHRRFLDADRDHLADVVDVDHVPCTIDASLRPNQLLALGGLPLAVVEGARARRAVDAIERALVTPLGLRSLAPSDRAYTRRYAGGVRERDAAYHQGTAWPWLTTAFVEAWLRTRPAGSAASGAARARFLEPLEAHLAVAGRGHVSEIADGDAPHTPGGCPFQAWSVGELLRLRKLLAARGAT